MNKKRDTWIGIVVAIFVVAFMFLFGGFLGF